MARKKPFSGNLIGAIISFGFLALALTFGMGEWSPPPETASVPSSVTPR